MATLEVSYKSGIGSSCIRRRQIIESVSASAHVGHALCNEVALMSNICRARNTLEAFNPISARSLLSRISLRWRICRDGVGSRGRKLVVLRVSRSDFIHFDDFKIPRACDAGFDGIHLVWLVVTHD